MASSGNVQGRSDCRMPSPIHTWKGKKRNNVEHNHNGWSPYPRPRTKKNAKWDIRGGFHPCMRRFKERAKRGKANRLHPHISIRRTSRNSHKVLQKGLFAWNKRKIDPTQIYEQAKRRGGFHRDNRQHHRIDGTKGKQCRRTRQQCCRNLATASQVKRFEQRRNQ